MRAFAEGGIGISMPDGESVGAFALANPAAGIEQRWQYRQNQRS